MRQWTCDECHADQRVHRERGRCGGPLDGHPAAQMDAQGRPYVAAYEACGRAGAYSDDLRLYSCPVALASDVGASALPSLYAASEGGLSPQALGFAGLTRGAVEGVHTIAAAWRWRDQIKADERRRQREAETRGAARGHL